MIRTQGARLRINERLKEALNKLAENRCYGCNPGTIFVLPVDDFYLKPDASLELLRLLRMISIPRLFFLVMGDINTVEALFIEKSLADWTEVAGIGLFAARSERLDDALTRARELRARYLRKLLPPSQRATIQVMDWYEALYFEVGCRKNNVSDVEILQELLIQVELDRPWDESKAKFDSLLTFLISPSLSPITPEEKQKRAETARGDRTKKDDAEKKLLKEQIALRKPRAAYTAVQILDATPREIMDLGFALREVRRNRDELEYLKGEAGEIEDSDKIPMLLSSVRDIVNLVREEHSFLNEKQQKILEGILPTRLYSPEDINFEMDRLCLTPSPRTWKKVSGVPQSKELWVRNHRSWDLRVNTKKYATNPPIKSTSSGDSEGLEQDTKDPFAKLPPRPAAWFVLLHDLAVEWRPDSVTENLVENLCEELNGWKAKKIDGNVALPPNQECDSQLKYISLIPKKSENSPDPDPSEDFSGWAICFDKDTYEHFPMPIFKTFRDLDQFLFIWSSGLEWLWKHNGDEADRLFDLWELAGSTILLEAYDKYKDFSGAEVDWREDFAKRLKDIRDKQHKDSNASVNQWVTKVNNSRKGVIGDPNSSSPSSSEV